MYVHICELVTKYASSLRTKIFFPSAKSTNHLRIHQTPKKPFDSMKTQFSFLYTYINIRVYC